MYGLIMLKEYLDEILDGDKAFDARAYDTSIRGTIALVDTKKSTIIGLVNLIRTHKISADEYCKWHSTGKWKDMIFQVKNVDVAYYAYDFINPRRLTNPIKIVKTGKIWTKIDDNIELNVQEKLF